MGAFVGRARELEIVGGAVTRGAPLVTVWGTGGIGKTRIVRELATRLRRAVVVVELDAVTTVEGLIAAVATRLDVPIAPAARAEQAIAQVGRSLRARGDALLVLDGFDALVREGAGALVRWIAEAPALRLLVTSRERLRVEAESAFELLPLDVEGARDGDVGDAVTLLVARVRELGGTVDEVAMPRLRRLAAELEGIPLALELAAARLVVLGVEAVLARLPDRLGLLARAGGGAPARQTTMRGTIAWSWDLLAPVERRCLARLAVFRGGFTAEAAAHVIDADAADVLGQLRDKSMLQLRAGDVGTSPRFALYEAVRELALERLVDDPTGADALARHDVYFADLASRLAARISASGDVEALGVLAVELDNLLEVHARALARADADAMGRAATILVAVDPALQARMPAEARVTLWRATIAALGKNEVEPALATALQAGLGRALLAAGERQASRTVLARAVKRCARNAGLPGDELLLDLGVTRHAVGDLAGARRAYAQVATSLARRTRSNSAGSATRTLARAHGNLGAVLHDLRDPVGARRHYDRAVALAARAGDARVEGITWANLSVLAQEAGKLAAARAGLERAVDLLARARDRRLGAIAIGNLGMVEIELGALEGAALHLERALAELSLIGDRRSEGLAHLRLAILAAILRDPARARSRFAESRAVFARIDDDDGAGLVALGEAFVDVGEPAYDRTLADDALADAERSRGRVGSLVSRSDDARTIARLLRATLERLARGAPVEAEPPAEALVVARDLSMFRAPGARAWRRIDDHAAAALILGKLLEVRGRDRCATVFELADAGWPDLKIQPASAKNRVYVALAWLRRVGLRDAIVRRGGGYALAPDLRVERVSPPRRVVASSRRRAIKSD